MPVTPDQIPLDSAGRAAAQAMLDTWDAQDPWAPTNERLGAELIALAYRLAAPLVPQLDSAEAAGKFLRAAIDASPSR